MEENYKLLGINKDSTEEEIEKAYKKKAKKLHPYRGGSKEDFQKLGKAYEEVMKYKKYDPRLVDLNDLLFNDSLFSNNLFQMRFNETRGPSMMEHMMQHMNEFDNFMNMPQNNYSEVSRVIIMNGKARKEKTINQGGKIRKEYYDIQ